MLRTIQCQYETVHFAPSALNGGSRILSQNLAKLLATDALGPNAKRFTLASITPRSAASIKVKVDVTRDASARTLS
jgi:hypothetical protein